MTAYDHIQELRAELAVSLDAGERRQIEAELVAVMQQHAADEAAFDALMSAEPSLWAALKNRVPAQFRHPSGLNDLRSRLHTWMADDR